MVSETPHLGVGLYTLSDAARITGARPNTIRHWMANKGGIVRRHFAAEKLLTFEELMEVHFIQMFRKEGVSLQAIRKASQKAAILYGTDYPFAFKRFDTDGRTVFATLIQEKPDGVLVEDLERGQYVFSEIMRPFFRKLEYRVENEMVARFWPRTKRGRVVLDPERKFGKPIDANSGISTSAIHDAVTAGGGQKPSTVARWLNIPIAAVKAAIAFEESLS